MGPRIFVSAASSELKTARQLVANSLSRLGYEPVSQEIFGTEAGDLRQVLRDKIDGCDGLLQLVGYSYGAEPPTVESEFSHMGFTRVSYTQFEFLYARARNKKTWLIYTDNGCTLDHPLDELDRPRAPEHPDPAGYQAERRALQEAWRQRWKQEGHLRHGASSDIELELKIERLKDEFAELRRGFRRWQQRLLAASLVAVVLTCAILGGLVWMKQDLHRLEGAAQAQRELTVQGYTKTESQLADLKQQQSLTAARIRRHLIESSEQTRDRALAAAESEPRSDERERLRELADKEHAGRLSRIDEIAARFVEVENQSDSTDEFREMARILTEENEYPIEKSLAYAAKRRETRWDRVLARKASDQQRNRADLQIDLQAASLEATNGHSADARRLFEKVLEFEPDWPEVLESYAWFLYYESLQAGWNGLTEDGIVDANRAVELATRLAKVQAATVAPSVLSITRIQLGGLLSFRGHAGDAEQALQYFTRSLKESELRLAQAPESELAQRDVSMCLYYLSGLLSNRDEPGDAEQALKYSMRDRELAERVLSKSPDSAKAARNVCVSLTNAGDLLSKRGQPGDTEEALQCFERALQISERLMARGTDDAPHTSTSISSLGDLISAGKAAQEVSSDLSRLGALLLERNRPGDFDRALKYFQRNLEITRGMLAKAPQSTQASRELVSSLNHLGNFYQTRGLPTDTETALAHYKQALEISEALLSREPESGRAVQDLAYCLHRIGDVLAERRQPGDIEVAMSHFQRSLEASEAALARTPRSSAASEDVFSSRYRLGDLLTERQQAGDFEIALSHYIRLLEFSERRLSATTNSVDAAHKVSFSLTRLGDLFGQRNQAGDSAIALDYYQRALEVSESIFTKRPDSDQAAKDVFVSLYRVGVQLNKRRQPGDVELALKYTERNLAIAERLLAKSPESNVAQMRVSRCLARLGELLAESNQPKDTNRAIDCFLSSLEMTNRQLSQTPESAQVQRDVTLCLYHLGALLIKRALPGDIDQALSCYQRYLEISEHQFARNPGSEMAAWNAMCGYDRLGDCEARLDRFADAVAHFEKAVVILDQMVSRQQNKSASQKHKETVLKQIAICQQAQASIGDWDTVLKEHHELIPMRLSLLSKRGQTDELVQAATELRQLATTPESSDANQKRGAMLHYASLAYEFCAKLVTKDKPISVMRYPVPNSFGAILSIDEPELTETEQIARKNYLDLSRRCWREALATGYQKQELNWNQYELLSHEQIEAFKLQSK